MMEISTLEPELGHYHYRQIVENDGLSDALKIQGKSPVILTGNTSVDNFLASLDTAEALEITELEFDEMKRRFEQWWVAHAWGYDDNRHDAQQETRDYDAALRVLRAYYQSPLSKANGCLSFVFSPIAFLGTSASSVAGLIRRSMQKWHHGDEVLNACLPREQGLQFPEPRDYRGGDQSLLS